MEVLTDSIFEQGVTHDKCEDYTLHGDDNVVISDGCSSGQHTDWGSRLICAAGKLHIPKQESHPMQFFQAVAGTVQAQYRTFGLPESSLTATLLTLRKQGDFLRALVMGDGIVGGKRRDGRWKIHVIDYPTPLGAGGAPFYLKYQIFNEVDLWLERHNPNYTVTTYFGNIMAPGIEYPSTLLPTLESRLESWAQLVTEDIQNKEFDKERPYEEFKFPIEEYEFAFVTTDGPEHFYERRVTETQRYNEDLCCLDVLRVLLDLRFFPPGFLHLQRDWAFKQDRKGTFKKLNWFNGDDVGTGAIYCGET